MIEEEFTVGEKVFGPILITIMGILSLACIITFIFGICYASQKYSVWSSSMDGKAQLAHAKYSKQIAVQEAIAKQEAAKELAKAEVIRARGVAQANKIIGQSLNKNEAYLTYLWIQGLEHTTNQVIYIPTEANLPILEANRFGKKRK